MSLSVTDPISQAIERTRVILFQPFNLEKWLLLGLCAFTANLGTGGNFTFNFPITLPPGEFGGWFRDHVVSVVVVLTVIVLMAIGFALFCLWLSSRGQFMFLDGVVHNRGAVLAPWHEYRHEGNSLFGFQIVLGLSILLALLAIVALALLLAAPDIRSRDMSGYSAAAIALGMTLGVTLMLAAAMAWTILIDFIVPVMYLRRVTVRLAWRVFFAELLAGNKGTFALYLLMRLLLGWLIGILVIVALLLTCCLAALPYVGTVILLPVLVFLRAYPLQFLEQFGPDWRVFSAPLPTAVPQHERRFD